MEYKATLNMPKSGFPMRAGLPQREPQMLENWKKIDDLTEKLTSACGFAPDNKLITAMERFVGVYMAAGGSEQEALDSVLACVLLPAALTLLSTNTSEDSPALSQLLDAGFGMENLPACAEMLKKFSAA